MSYADSERKIASGLATDTVAKPSAGVRPGSRSLLLVPTATLIVGLLLTGALVWVSAAQYSSNEKRLLTLRVRDAESLLTAAIPTIQTPLASAAELADATNGDVRKFKRLVAPYVGSGPGQSFASISLWRLSATQRGPVAVEGAPPKLASSLSQAPAYFKRAERTSKLSLIGLLTLPNPRLGYGLTASGRRSSFVAYGESAFPANRRSPIQKSSAFAGLDYVLYLGSDERPENLLLTSVNHLPLRGRQHAETVGFGDSALTLAMSSRVSLAGSLPAKLPWIIAIIGVLLAVGAAAGAMRLMQRRLDAEQLAERLEATASATQRLYTEQRTIAQTLQHALLPDALPDTTGVETSARYESGEGGVDIGGDWYDVIAVEDDRLLLVVGDVSGRGLQAATTMAALRFAIHAYAAQNDPPATILTKLSGLVSVTDSGQIATILCVLVDINGRELTVTSAGHLPPLLVSGGDGSYVRSEVGLPIGVEAGSSYTSTTLSAPHKATLIAFTDGLVERRSENLDDGLTRLRAAATARDAALPELLSKLVNELRQRDSVDDVAVLGIRWTS